MKQNNIISQYNEYDFLEKIFAFESSYRNLIYAMMFVEDKPLKVVSMVLKYLLKVKEEKPILVEKIIRKWCVLVIYYFCVNKYNYPLQCSELEQLLEREITIEDLSNCEIKSKNTVSIIFNDNEENNLNYKHNISLFCKSLLGIIPDYSNIKKVRELSIPKIKNLLASDNYFFNDHNGKVYTFEKENKYKNNKSFDRLIPEVINSTDPVKFKIELTQEEFENLKKNYDLTNGKKELGDSVIKKALPVVFGYMISNIIKDENYMLDKSFVFLSKELLNLSFKQRKCDMKLDGFIPYNNNQLDKQKIVTCCFRLNEREYILSTEGLKEI